MVFRRLYTLLLLLRQNVHLMVIAVNFLNNVQRIVFIIILRLLNLIQKPIIFKQLFLFISTRLQRRIRPRPTLNFQLILLLLFRNFIRFNLRLIRRNRPNFLYILYRILPKIILRRLLSNNGQI